nr:radical SAM family heme chaperone HemW [Anaerolineae bacterium]
MTIRNPQLVLSPVEVSTTHNPVALYVHVPFCRARCAYCDFNTYAGLDELMPAYVAAVCREIEAAGERWGHRSVPTVYFGGGTPSLLPLNLLAELFQVLCFTFHVSDDAEVTLEANPGTVTPTYLHGLQALGVNRLSLGVQSAHDDELRLLGRFHTWAQAVEAVGWTREAGFANLSLDLIFGLPGQTPARWHRTLEAALALSPEHLSLYCLSVEEGTVLERRIASGALPAPDEDLAAEMYELAEEVLAEAGFFHYEISNWARVNFKAQRRWTEPGILNLKPDALSERISPYVCRHNLTYWRNEPWLGVGAGAHSWLGGGVLSGSTEPSGRWPSGRGLAEVLSKGQRWANVRHPREYIAALDRGVTPVAAVEVIDRRVEMGETMMLGLRLAEGVDDARFRARFGLGLERAFGEELRELRELGLVEWDGRVARLTARGRLLGNQAFARFV